MLNYSWGSEICLSRKQYPYSFSDTVFNHKVKQTVSHPAQPPFNVSLIHSFIPPTTFSSHSILLYRIPPRQRDGAATSTERYDSWIVGCHIDGCPSLRAQTILTAQQWSPQSPNNRRATHAHEDTIAMRRSRAIRSARHALANTNVNTRLRSQIGALNVFWWWMWWEHALDGDATWNVTQLGTKCQGF